MNYVIYVLRNIIL